MTAKDFSVDSNNVMRFILETAGKKEAVFLLLVMVLISILDLVGIAIIFPYIRIITNPGLLTEKIPHVFIFFGWIDEIQQVLVVSVALVLLFMVKVVLQGALVRYQNQRLAFFTAKITDDTVNRMLGSRYGLFQEIPGSELAGVAYSNTVHATIVFRSLIQIGNEICFLSVLIVSFLVFRPLTTLTIIVVIAMASALLHILVIRPTTRLGKEQEEIENKRYRLLYSMVNSIRDIKTMGLAGLFDDKNRDVSARYAKIAWRYNFNSELPKLLVETITLVGLVVSVLFVVSTGVPADTLLPVIGVVAMASLRTVPAFLRLISSVNNYKFYRSFVERLIFIRNRLSVLRHERIEDSIRFERSIELHGISFQYQDKIILHDINLTIDRGQFIGIVGVSGSGKTTLLDIITGLQPASTGLFFCDEKPFNPFTSKSMERIIGYVPQVLTLLDESIAYNISFDHDPDLQQLARVIRMANLDKMVTELPLGINTNVGENGMNLSGGQRQRIGIARALYRQPEIVVFDEATSALDAHAEQEISGEIEKLRGQVTVLMVSHRLPAVVNCDRIYVITHGAIEASGTHEELLGSSELYRDLYTLQTTCA